MNGVRIHPQTPEQLVSTVESFLACGRGHVVRFLAAHPTVKARLDFGYRLILNRGDLNVPDGKPVAWAQRLFGFPSTALPGTEAMLGLMEWGLRRGLTHYLYGASPETLDLLRGRLEAALPGIRIVGVESPPFRPLTDEEVDAASDRIRSAGAQVVWVGLGVPKQDWVGERLRVREAAPLILCVGAAFDFVAGIRDRAPAWMQRLSLEWLYRLVKEPGRLWKRYLLGNPLFLAGVARDRLLPGKVWRSGRPPEE